MIQQHQDLEKSGEGAPHKPLLGLYAIGRALRGDPRRSADAVTCARCFGG
jgi:hypothetical protein